MADRVKLTFSNLTTYVGVLKTINTNYFDLAEGKLKQSTDLGSSIIQAGWHFAGKSKIFNTVRNAEKRIDAMRHTNNQLIAILRGIKSSYETTGAQAVNHSNSLNIWDILKKIGITSAIIYNPVLLAIVSAILAGRTYGPVISINGNIKVDVGNQISGVSLAMYFKYFFNPAIIYPIVHPIGGPETSGVQFIEALRKWAANNGFPATSSGATNTTTGTTNTPTVMTAAEFSQLQSVLKKYENSPYVWGGSSTDGVDCSGLVMQAFKEAGIKTDFPHSAKDIYKMCTPVTNFPRKQVDLTNLHKGDLVFYSNGGPESIGHVAIYMGDGKIMHASSPSVGVVTTDLTYSSKANVYVARVKR